MPNPAVRIRFYKEAKKTVWGAFLTSGGAEHLSTSRTYAVSNNQAKTCRGRWAPSLIRLSELFSEPFHRAHYFACPCLDLQNHTPGLPSEIQPLLCLRATAAHA